MYWIRGLRSLWRAVDTEYDRRIRAASAIVSYQIPEDSDAGEHEQDSGRSIDLTVLPMAETDAATVCIPEDEG